MARTDLFIKVEVEHDERETPERLAAEICRQVRKIYGVQSAELSHFTAQSGKN
jgi:RNA-binding protein YhbY